MICAQSARSLHWPILTRHHQISRLLQIVIKEKMTNNDGNLKLDILDLKQKILLITKTKNITNYCNVLVLLCYGHNLTVPRQFVYGHFVYDTSSTDISSTDISSTTVYQRVGQLYIQLLFQ